MANRNLKSEGVDPITLALSGVLLISAWCAWRVWIAAEAIKTAAYDKDTYAQFIVEHADGSKDLQSDNQVLADAVNRSQQALLSAQGEALALIFICALLMAALAYRECRLVSKKGGG